MFINRNWLRPEQEDFEKSVKPLILKHEAATPIHMSDGTTVGWEIKPMYE